MNNVLLLFSRRTVIVMEIKEKNCPSIEAGYPRTENTDMLFCS